MSVFDSKIPIGISSCLLGDEVRYDGSHKKSRLIIDVLSPLFEFQRCCPEMAIGLGVPREPIRLVESDEGIHCIGTQSPELDVTDALIGFAKQQQSWHQEIYGYIFKRGSPSCGVGQVKLYRDQGMARIAVGLYAKTLMQQFPDMPVADESQLASKTQLADFSQKVQAYFKTCTDARKILKTLDPGSSPG